MICSKCGKSETTEVTGKLVWNDCLISVGSSGIWHGRRCQSCRRKAQQSRRRHNKNADTKRYEKTKAGFLMRLYRNMKSRVSGVQWRKAHLYKHCDILEKEYFYRWAQANPDFHTLFTEWEESKYNRKKTPSVNRINPKRGYSLSNMEWITQSENSRLGALNQKS